MTRKGLPGCVDPVISNLESRANRRTCHVYCLLPCFLFPKSTPTLRIRYLKLHSTRWGMLLIHSTTYKRERVESVQPQRHNKWLARHGSKCLCLRRSQAAYTTRVVRLVPSHRMVLSRDDAVQQERGEFNQYIDDNIASRTLQKNKPAWQGAGHQDRGGEGSRYRFEQDWTNRGQGTRVITDQH